MRTDQPSNPSVTRRPVRAAVGGVVGIALSAGIVAFAAHRWFDVILLYGFLLGMCGGLMAWLVLDELDPDLQGTRTMAVAGLVTAAATYGFYEYLRYRLDVAGLAAPPGWWEYLAETARDGASFGRVGRSSTIDQGAG